MKFVELDLVPELQDALKAINFVECTPVQSEVINPLLEGKDISALAQTGTGKTAAFLLPLLDRVVRGMRAASQQDGTLAPEKSTRAFSDWKSGQFVLVLVPTRELAEQVYQDFYRFRGSLEIEAVSVYGGTSYEEQKSKIGKGVQFVIGTPGRLIDLYETHHIDFRQVRAIVFDEADRMFDMGFKDDMRFILQRVPKDRQVLLFSATLNFEVLHTVYRYGVEPIEFNLSRDQVKAENVEDMIYHVGQDEKPRFLLSLITKENPRQVIIFSNFKHNVELLAAFLSKNNVPAMGISSLLTQAQRNRVISSFKEENNQNILVATDVAARGLDIKNVDLVINYDLPDDAENYVHRIGRTGRAGAIGKAISLVSDRDVDALVRIEEYLKYKVNVNWLDEAELIQKFVPISAVTPNRKPKWEDKARREGAAHSRGEGRGGGPRSDGRGPRDSRGPRTENRSGGPRDQRGPRHDKSPSGSHQGSRPQIRPKGSLPQQGFEKKQGSISTHPKHKGQQNKNQHHKGKPRHQSKFQKPHSKPTPQAPVGLLNKVSGFFKKLFS